MPHLWNLEQIHPARVDGLPGDTVPALFWNAVAQRADRVWMREKEFGLSLIHI